MSSDDRVGETTHFTYRPSTEWYWFPQQKPNEVSMLKYYDLVIEILVGSGTRTSPGPGPTTSVKFWFSQSPHVHLCVPGATLRSAKVKLRYVALFDRGSPEA